MAEMGLRMNPLGGPWYVVQVGESELDKPAWNSFKRNHHKIRRKTKESVGPETNWREYFQDKGVINCKKYQMNKMGIENCLLDLPGMGALMS